MGRGRKGFITPSKKNIWEPAPRKYENFIYFEPRETAIVNKRFHIIDPEFLKYLKSIDSKELLKKLL